MSNWCSNILTVQGDRTVLDTLGQAVRGVDRHGDLLVFSLQAIAPTPEPLLQREPKSFTREELVRLRQRLAGSEAATWEPIRKLIEQAESEYPDPEGDALIAEYGADAWYSWRSQHWGTKWDVESSTRRPDPPEGDIIRYYLTTAWSPPKPAIEALSGRFTDLFFHLCYHEDGTDVAGFVAFKAGRRVAWAEGSWASAITGAFNFRRELLDLVRQENERDDEDAVYERVMSVFYPD
jgi:Ferredoxin-like domain in Api92-like protein